MDSAVSVMKGVCVAFTVLIADVVVADDEASFLRSRASFLLINSLFGVW